MTTQNLPNVHTESILALIQRCREEAVIQADYEGADRDVIDSFFALLDSTDETLVALKRRVEAIALNPDFSDAKKTKLAMEEIRQAYKELQSVRKAATTKADAAAEARARLMAVPKAQTDPFVDALQGYEIRQIVRPLPVQERMKVYAEAIATKNVAVQRALANDPMREAFIPREYADRVMTEHLQLKEGVQWTRLKTLELIAARLSTIATALDLSLQGFGEIPAFDGKSVRHVDLQQRDQTAPPPKHTAADVPPDTQPRFQ